MLELEMFEQYNLDYDEVIVISHNDLDGAGPIIICNQLYKKVKYFTVANNSVDKVVNLVLSSPEHDHIKLIFITDVSIVGKNLAEKITKINETTDRQIFLFDHHDTALWLNDYDWAVVKNEKDSSGDSCKSATLLFFEYLSESGQFENKLDIHNFTFLLTLAGKISDWDTWRWTKTGDDECRQLSMLYSKTGINYFLKKFESCYKLLTDEDNALIQDLDNKNNFIIVPGIKKTAATMTIPFDQGNGYVINRKVKCVSVSDAPNDLAEQLYEDGIDYVIMFYSNGTVSVRSRVETIHLGNWAKIMAGEGGSGGGHLKSAGFTLNKENLWIYLQYLQVRYEGIEL